MRTYAQLTDEEKKKAVSYFLGELLKPITDGVLRFNDRLNGDGLQARIDAACKKADDMKTPWFAHEYILETCREDLEGMASVDAEEAFYLDAGEHAVRADKLANTIA